MDIDELNNDSLLKYLKSNYPDRTQPENAEELLAELYNRGYHTIGKLDSAIKRTKSAVECFEKENPPDKGGNGRYSADGIVKVSILLLDDDFFKYRTDSRGCPRRNFFAEKLEKYRKYILPESNNPAQ